MDSFKAELAELLSIPSSITNTFLFTPDSFKFQSSLVTLPVNTLQLEFYFHISPIFLISEVQQHYAVNK